MQTSKWYEIKALKTPATSTEIYIYGNIGDKWDEEGVVASTLVKDIAALDVETITVRINSYGGSVTDGLAIFNALKRHPAKIRVEIEGVALSIASYIAMAGDEITIAANAQLMIHAPWGITAGNSVALRDQADVLDRYARALSSGYADCSGQPLDTCLALLSDGKDHWYSADEALDAGFVHFVGRAQDASAQLASSFSLSRFPLNRSTKSKEPLVPDVIPFSRSKEMNTEVLALFKPFMQHNGVSALQTDVLSDPALSVEQIQARLLVQIGKDATPVNASGAYPRIETVSDETDKARAAATDAILVRAGVEKDRSIINAMGSNPYRGAKLLDLAREALTRTGVQARGMSQMEVVAAAFTQGTSDFPVLLENVMHKTLQGAYATAALTWNRFCTTGSVSDFRAHHRYRTGSFGVLSAVNELGEFTNKSIPDGEKASITASTKGNIINISRQAIINDDLGAFVGLSASLGRAAARTIESDVYALLSSNNGLGPTLGDGKTLFHVEHKNITAGTLLSMSGIDADRVAMASQVDISGNDYLDIRPAVLLVPISMGGNARSINAAQYDPDTANKMQKPNIVNGLFKDIVDTPRLSGTRRYLFADPMEVPVLEVAFLDGAQSPYLESNDGFSVDGAQYKVRLDYGIAAVDYRGAVTNIGN